MGRTRTCLSSVFCGGSKFCFSLGTQCSAGSKFGFDKDSPHVWLNIFQSSGIHTLHWKCQLGKWNEHSAHIWRIFMPMYCRPSKKASCSIFQYVKNEPWIGPEWCQVSGIESSLHLPNWHFQWSVTWYKKFEFRFLLEFQSSIF